MENPASNQPQSENQENLQEETQEVSPVEVLSRVMVAEQLLNELLKGFGMAGQAVNRLESFTFSLVALILKKEIATIDEIRDLQRELSQYEDLNEFWGVEPPPEASTEETPTASDEPDDEM